MKFEIYCDESGLEALTDKTAHTFTAIGGIWFPKDYRESFKEGVKAIKAKNNVTGELKWKKISPAYEKLYRELIDFFFDSGYLRFRVILIEVGQVDHIKFNNKDPELGFYKFYYQLIHHWLYDFNEYDIFLDLKVNRDKGRLQDLKETLDLSNLTSKINQVQGLESIQSLGIQMADILTGLASSKFNQQHQPDSVKARLIKHVEEKHLTHSIVPTSKWEEKFNVFKINLNGGW